MMSIIELQAPNGYEYYHTKNNIRIGKLLRIGSMEQALRFDLRAEKKENS